MDFCLHLIVVGMISLKLDGTIYSFQHTAFQFQDLLNFIFFYTVGTSNVNTPMTTTITKCNTISGSSYVLMILVDNKARTFNLKIGTYFSCKILLSSIALCSWLQPQDVAFEENGEDPR